MMNYYFAAFSRRVSTMLLYMVLCIGSAWARQGKKPNFIIMLADDLRRADLGADGSRIETSNLEKMAREGMKFTHLIGMHEEWQAKYYSNPPTAHGKTASLSISPRMRGVINIKTKIKWMGL
jgi:hypothetical protein